MATAKTPNARTRTRVSPKNSPLNAALAGVASQLTNEKPEVDADDEIIMANVKQAFNFTDDNHKTTRYEAGAQKMPRSHAEHWYSQANGVTIVK